MLPREDLPVVFVEKKVSMKKCSFILLYRSIQLFVPMLWDRLELYLLMMYWEMTSRVRFADSRSIIQILERWEASIPLGLLAWAALTMMSSRYMLPLVD